MTDLIKASIIIGASIVISTMIYSNSNKYVKYDHEPNNGMLYTVLNKRTGEVKTFGINNSTTWSWQTSFNDSEGVFIKTKTIVENDE